MDDAIDVPFSVLESDTSILDDLEYKAMVSELESQYPTVSGKGFDLTQISGDLAGRTAKAIVLQLACTGMSVADIADKIGKSPSLVGRFLADAIREASPLNDVEVLRDFELRKLDFMERKCWEMFDKSCEPEVTEVEGESAVGPSSSTKKKGQSGNPAYQKVLIEIGKRRDRLLGLEKPKLVNIEKTERQLRVTEIVVDSRSDVEAMRTAGLLESK